MSGRGIYHPQRVAEESEGVRSGGVVVIGCSVRSATLREVKYYIRLCGIVQGVGEGNVKKRLAAKL